MDTLKCAWCETTLAVDDDGDLIDEAFMLVEDDHEEGTVFCSGECLIASL